MVGEGLDMGLLTFSPYGLGGLSVELDNFSRIKSNLESDKANIC